MGRPPGLSDLDKKGDEETKGLADKYLDGLDDRKLQKGRDDSRTSLAE